MIKYRLKCSHGHIFESWFASADAFDALATRKMLSCAVCGCEDVEKAMMAPPIRASRDKEKRLPSAPNDKPTQISPEQAQRGEAQNKSQERDHQSSIAQQSEGEAPLKALKERFEKEATYVGSEFAKEARAQHSGEKDAKLIWGESKPSDVRALINDGVPVAPLPFIPKKKLS